MPKSVMPSGAMKSARIWQRLQKPATESLFVSKLSSSNFKAVTLAEHLKMKVKIKTLAWKQLSHSAWLVILTCSFSGVFICNLWFLL